MHQQFARSFDSLQQIFAFVQTFCEGEGVDADHQKAVEFGIEEIFTNIVKYSKEGTSDIRIQLEKKDKQLRITVIDFDVEPFDPTRAPEATVDAPVEERKPGGLGLHLTRKLFDSMEYEYEDRKSIITLTRNLEVT